MAQLFTPRSRGHDLGVRAAATARVAGRMAGRSRWYRAATTAAGTMFRSLHSVVRVLWLEVTGLIFVFFAVIGVTYLVREFHKQGHSSPRLLAGLCFSVLFAWFGISSFWRTRQKQR